MVFVSWNAISQLFADIVIESLMFADAIPKIEFRVAFVILTFLSAVLAAHTLSDIRQNELDTTVQAIRVGLMVEAGLILEDAIFITQAQFPDQLWLRFYYRVPFVCLTFINVVLMFVVGFQMKILVYVFWPCYEHCCCVKKRQSQSQSQRQSQRQSQSLEGKVPTAA
jgi:TRAP-type C4-dicarboxylate transport system permease large subunit